MSAIPGPANQPRRGPQPTLALERTALAWSRTGLAVVGCLAVLARRFIRFESRGDRVGAFVLIAVAGLSWSSALLMSRRRAGSLDPDAGPPEGQLRLVVISTMTIGLGAFVIGLFPPQ